MCHTAGLRRGTLEPMAVIALPTPPDPPGGDRPDPMTVRDTVSGAAAAFTETLDAATTRASYAETLTALATVTGAGHPVAELTPDHYVAAMNRWTAASPATWNRHLSALVSFTTWAQRQDLLATNPARRLARRKTTRRGDRSIPYARLNTLFTGTRHTLRERVLWRMVYETAARAEEVLTLNIDDLDPEFRRARVVSKGGAIEYVHWATGTARLLPRLIAGRTAGPVFLADRRAATSGPRAPAAADIDPVTGRGRLSYPRAEHLFKIATKDLDPHGAGWTLHQLRHSALTHLAAAGRTATELQAKSRHQHLGSLGFYVHLGEQTSARITAEHDPAARRRPR